jgi:hypothetical protein
MKIIYGLLDTLRGRLCKRLVWRARIPDVAEDPRVTKAIADKIVDDARKHRLTIEGDMEQEGEKN